MAGERQVPPKISASLSSQGEAQQPTQEKGVEDDADDKMNIDACDIMNADADDMLVC